jgi:hypothetical protein
MGVMAVKGAQMGYFGAELAAAILGSKNESRGPSATIMKTSSMARLTSATAARCRPRASPDPSQA